MKITKRQLRRIIREEYSRIVEQGSTHTNHSRSEESFEQRYRRGMQGMVNDRGMEADILDYVEILEMAKDPEDEREVRIKMADAGFKWNGDTYLDALDDYFDRMP